MLCQTCEKRKSCVEPCADLEAHLKELEGYQRELPFSPVLIHKLAEFIDHSWPDLVPDLPYIWNKVMYILPNLPRRLLEPFILHYYHELWIRDVAKKLGLHRSTVNRRLRAAEAFIRREFELMGWDYETVLEDDGADGDPDDEEL